MKICFVLPRNMSFAAASATSIDLCVRDLAVFSEFRTTVSVLGEPVSEPFPGLDFVAVPRSRWSGQAAYAKALARTLDALKPDVVIVEQHVESAAIIARHLATTPVILHRHGMSPNYRGLWRRWRYGRCYRRMARILCVSEALSDNVKRNFPDLADRTAVILNGIDTALWQPTEKRQSVVFAGRAVIEKGVMELSTALAEVLIRHQDWRASFLLAISSKDVTTVNAMKKILAPVSEQIDWQENATIDEVRHAVSQSAIALVPSIVREGFGRTAMEAHAAGAAVISSGQGALREVSADAALYLPEVTAQALSEAIQGLIVSPAELSRWQTRSRQRAMDALDIRTCARNFDRLCETLVSRTEQ